MGYLQSTQDCVSTLSKSTDHISVPQVIVLKSALRHIPGIGWAMQMLRYIFLHRSWTRDEERMSCVMRSIQRDGPAAVLMFPEGTDLSKDMKARSHQFAKDRDLPLYENVLIPRSRGFAHVFNLMMCGSEPLVVWDVTVGYVSTLCSLVLMIDEPVDLEPIGTRASLREAARLIF